LLNVDVALLEVGVNNHNLYPIEYSFNLQWVPPLKLHFKVGCPIMLLCNIAPNCGLCNGSQFIVTWLNGHVIEAHILTGAHARETTFDRRIRLQPTTLKIFFKFSQRQFLVKVVFTMIINKSQAHFIKYVSLEIWTPILSHGQLYVALSRTTSINSLKIFLPIQNLPKKWTLYILKY
jgi:ATP-dependent DNA helicase PIF1